MWPGPAGRWTNWKCIMAVSVIAPLGRVTPAQPTEGLPEPSPWDPLVSGRGGLGYKDNVALAHFAPQGSGYFHSGADVVVSRLPLDGNEFSFTATIDDSRFFEPTTVDHETVAFASAQYGR